MKPVRVLLDPDSFTGTMSALTVAEALAEGVRATGAEALLRPLADGGEGTTVILHAVLGGELVEPTVTGPGPLGAPVTGSFLLTDHGRTAVLDTATASGLDLVPAGKRDAEAATSAGTGQLLAAAATRGRHDPAWRGRQRLHRRRRWSLGRDHRRRRAAGGATTHPLRRAHAVRGRGPRVRTAEGAPTPCNASSRQRWRSAGGRWSC